MVDHPLEHWIRRVAGLIAVVMSALLVAWAAAQDPPRGQSAFFTDRESLPCCFQALYCDELDRGDWRDWKEKLVCDSWNNKNVLWDGLGAATPKETFSCSALEAALEA